MDYKEMYGGLELLQKHIAEAVSGIVVYKDTE